MDQPWYEDIFVQLFIAAAFFLALRVLGVIDPMTMAMAFGGAGALVIAVHVSELHKQIDRLERQLDRLERNQALQDFNRQRGK